jgi:hypothetical protein
VLPPFARVLLDQICGWLSVWALHLIHSLVHPSGDLALVVQACSGDAASCTNWCKTSCVNLLAIFPCSFNKREWKENNRFVLCSSFLLSVSVILSHLFDSRCSFNSFAVFGSCFPSSEAHHPYYKNSFVSASHRPSFHLFYSCLRHLVLIFLVSRHTRTSHHLLVHFSTTRKKRTGKSQKEKEASNILYSFISSLPENKNLKIPTKKEEKQYLAFNPYPPPTLPSFLTHFLHKYTSSFPQHHLYSTLYFKLYTLTLTITY